MSDIEHITIMEDSADGLGDSLASPATLMSGFDGELRRMRESLAATGKDVATLERGLSKGLRRAFDGVVFDGARLGDALDIVVARVDLESRRIDFRLADDKSGAAGKSKAGKRKKKR